jgi:hypothetical protein
MVSVQQCGQWPLWLLRNVMQPGAMPESRNNLDDALLELVQ